MKHRVARCFILQDGDELTVYLNYSVKVQLSSVHRIPSKSLNSETSENVSICVAKNGKRVTEIDLDANVDSIIPDNLFYSNGFFSFFKRGNDDVQVIFIADTIANLNLFIFKEIADLKSMKKVFVPRNDVFFISYSLLNSLIQELRRALKSSNPVFVIAQILNQFFPNSFFSAFNRFFRKLSQNPFLKYIEQSLFVCFNRIGKSNLIQHFQNSISFFDFQIFLFKKLSFGLGFFIISFLNFCQEDSFMASRLFYSSPNYIIYLALVASVRPPQDDNLLSRLLQIPCPSLTIQPFHIPSLSIFCQFVFRKVFKDKPESKIRFKIDYSYQNLLQAVSTRQELDLMYLNHCLNGYDKLNHPEEKPGIIISDSFAMDILGNDSSDCIDSEKYG